MKTTIMTLGIVVCAVMLLVGCSKGSDENTAPPAPSASPTSPSAAPAPSKMSPTQGADPMDVLNNKPVGGQMPAPGAVPGDLGTAVKKRAEEMESDVVQKTEEAMSDMKEAVSDVTGEGSAMKEAAPDAGSAMEEAAPDASDAGAAMQEAVPEDTTEQAAPMLGGAGDKTELGTMDPVEAMRKQAEKAKQAVPETSSE